MKEKWQLQKNVITSGKCKIAESDFRQHCLINCCSKPIGKKVDCIYVCEQKNVILDTAFDSKNAKTVSSFLLYGPRLHPVVFWGFF